MKSLFFLTDTNIIRKIDFKEMFQYHLDTGSVYYCVYIS